MARRQRRETALQKMLDWTKQKPGCAESTGHMPTHASDAAGGLLTLDDGFSRTNPEAGIADSRLMNHDCGGQVRRIMTKTCLGAD